MNTTPNAIEVQHLSKQYKESTVLALNDVSFEVRKGEVYGILGPNGAGKTTLMSILFGSIKPTMGAEIGRACVGKECRSRWSPYH